ncbi:RNA-binding S4 domain-containing protein [Saccharobesus litoralis]|uniref:RNA-binding S4 domain-containing protein n=1 Tax=Saccharobesus litoralis TaxID=2172099 RepID=A0A2S0VVQ4_9ALTE|nr:RNA-binding S4 domain-containing protein [Saccharobesus litoralis]AWB68275.1 RNA-binding S4 domain-containing protein [Saccharobesus litoralis]
MQIIYINREPVELYKILKFENLVAGGGEAKLVIAEGYVLVNGELETQKRKKIYHGDVIEFDGETFQVEREAGVVATAKSASSTQSKTTSKSENNKPTKVKRPAIRF